MTNNSDEVDLGFAEECSPIFLTNRYFVSKIGGRPAWLNLKSLPKREELDCAKCGEPMTFLCQVYAPEENNPECFHRTIFLFLCCKETCFLSNDASNFVAFRNQLPRENDFYSHIPPDESLELPEIESPIPLCEICGCTGQFSCSKCKNVQYCGALHQKWDWKNGHKALCQNKQKRKIRLNKFLLKEFEIVIEPNDSVNHTRNGKTIDDDVDEKRRLVEFEQLQKSGETGDFKDIPDAELEQFTNENTEDKEFLKFKKIIEEKPDQILRYHKNGEPLWITKCNEKQPIVQDCEQCGSPRRFEFQIMPQMLHYLKNTSLDWGVLAVFTCSKCCDTKNYYAREFIIKQDLSVAEII